jgi:membrane protein implicated in regulation of membrane protease activity
MNESNTNKNIIYGKIKILINLSHHHMREKQTALFRGLVILFLIIIFTMINFGAVAKTIVKIGDSATVPVDEEIEFQGIGEGTFSWDFDDLVDKDKDGNHSNDNEATTKKATHKYSKSGEYTVTLTVYDDKGNISGIYKSKITVEEQYFMDPWILGLIFLIVGIIMFLVEASSPGFFIGIFASIFVVIGIIGISFPGLFFTIWSPIIAAVVGIITTVGIIIFYKKIAPPEAPTTTVGDSLIGKKGVVIADTDPDSLTKGKVKIGSDIWSATSAKRIKKGSRVIILESAGVHITVKKIEE